MVVLAVLILNLSACKKETVNTAASEKSRTTLKVLGKAVIINSNEKVPIDLTAFVDCANNGTGEEVVLVGDLHILTTFTITGNNIKGTCHFQPQGVSGVGSITGTKYNATGGTLGSFSGSFVNGQYQENFINNFRIIGQGSGNNLLIHQNGHFTFNSNGTVVSEIDSFTSNCK